MLSCEHFYLFSGATSVDPENSVQKRKQREANTQESSPQNKITFSRAYKVRRILIPQETQLFELIANLSNPHSTWKPEINACDWHGVECNSAKEVSALNWERRHSGLLGSLIWKWLPQTIERINVGSLHESKNELSGPVDFSSFPAGCTYVSLGYNQFGGGVDFTFLPSSLEYLSLTSNHFEGSVDLDKLPVVLQHLGVGLCAFSGPVTLTELPSRLKYLGLSVNRFSGSLELRYLPLQLEALYFHENDFEGPVDLSALPPNLKRLTLNSNRLSGVLDLSKIVVPIAYIKHGDNLLFIHNSKYFISWTLRVVNMLALLTNETMKTSHNAIMAH